jgi:hypothetical protein
MTIRIATPPIAIPAIVVLEIKVAEF